MGAEYELKYRANAQIHAAIQADHPGPWEQLAMQTTYFDTPSGSLSSRRYMLRTRLENGVSVCTLKTPGKGNERGEWEVQSGSIHGAISMLCKLGAPDGLAELCAEGLRPICGAEFTRQTLLLEAPGCSAELALDEGFLFSGAAQIPLCEIELELRSGSKEALEAFAGSFAAKYGLQSERKSKFARALSLYKEV